MVDIPDKALLAITLSEGMAMEAVQLRHALESGKIWRLHIRKPLWTAERIIGLINDIGNEFTNRISVHRQPEVAKAVGCGLHLPGKTSPEEIMEARASGIHCISVSCHDEAESLRTAPYTDYRFLSPIFASISKPGYGNGFSIPELAEMKKSGAIDKRTLALGGVTPDLLEEVWDLGFGGAAMSGFLFPETQESIKFLNRQ